jgi:Mg-chelatase subunit ChlD
MGRGLIQSRAEAVATYRPRDIMLVLDVSGSMNESRNGSRKMDELRESVRYFLNYIRKAKGGDRVGFTYYSTVAREGRGLSSHLNSVESALMSKLEPGGWTNIADGMMLAREEMVRNRREHAAPLMVVLTDGAANYIQPEDTVNVPEAKRRVLMEAELAKQEGIPVFTMALDSMTAEVDVELMAQVAEITNSESFHVIAGEMGVDGNLQLHEAFRRVALHRPLRLVE